MKIENFLLAGLVLLLASAGIQAADSAKADIVIRYLDAADALKSDSRLAYDIDLIQQLPRYAGPQEQVSLVAYGESVLGEQLLVELDKGQNINVQIQPAQIALDHSAELIPFPLMKGMLGYRDLLIHRQTAVRLDRVNDLAFLKRFSVGQGRDWADNPIYVYNGFTVETGIDISATFGLLEARQIDLFPLGLIESNFELERNRQFAPSSRVYEGMRIFYPFPVVFYVSKQHPEIVTFLHRAVRSMHEDGTIDVLLTKHFGRAIEAIQDSSVRTVRLRNPFISERIPVDQDNYWIR